ncbi:MAG: phosphatase PAP2 family protein [Pelodictyon phaeoclathratiforme]|nr:phosphatase PAP2 family protein [Pelodictyon phaeoclathratiforme]
MNRSLQWSISSATVALLCFVSFTSADIETALWFHALDNTALYTLFKKITLFGDSTGYLVGGLLLFVVFRNRNPFRAYAGLFLFSSVALSGLSADLVKYLAGRARPKLYFSEQLYGFAAFHWEHAWTSFPSGHSATALSVATVLATLYPRWRFAALFGALLIAFSRIFLAQHYVSDVIAGSFFGIVSTVLLYHLYFKTKFDDSLHNKI